jgi:aryl-alcohol dehydrogenase-like predicted oxidoreductase
VNRTIRLGDRDITRVGLGSNRLTATPAHVEFVRDAVEAGIELIDTAHLYTGGDSERTIGEAISALQRRPIVATKGGFQPGEGRRDVLRSQVDQSLRSLRTDSIDLYYLHRVDPETPMEDSLATITEYVDAGRIKLVGLSQVGVEEIERAREVLPIAAVQNQYNATNRAWDAVVDYCTGEGIVFVPFHPVRNITAQMYEVARERNATATQVALAWLLHRSPMVLPIPGTTSLPHVRENLGALEIELTDEELAVLS